jgi:UDP-N-acetylglucosamine diphosphorylase / glucose-1-phosphate thymidylyltransferase / UDP-N-acetylgalactosamine diphosphorylase / glucosamine-1-phosphate N-acetyltransferase / galactosamine-1-phosphate N-acetyltransferase
MAGLGSRFSIAGYKDPKPFIDVLGLPMIEQVISNLNMQDARFILLIRNDLTPNYLKILYELKKKYNIELITIELTTEGAACTTLFAYDFINDDNELIIANSDQLVDFSINDMRVDAITRELAGSVLVFEDTDPKWSFVKIDKDGYLIDLKEKNPISNLATVGIYYFRRGSDYVKSAIKMIITNDRTNNEFYVAPAYNYLNKFSKKKIGVYRISKSQMHGLGTPEDLEDYLRHESS